MLKIIIYQTSDKPREYYERKRNCQLNWKLELFFLLLLYDDERNMYELNSNTEVLIPQYPYFIN